MNMIHYAAKSVNILNLLLLMAVAAVASQVLVPFLNVTIKTSLPPVGKVSAEAVKEQTSRPIPAFADYLAVSDQNLFHPERKIPQEKRVENPNTNPVPKPDLVLYGTLIADNLSIAYIQDRKAPFSTPGRGARPRQMKKGESINGYILREIEPSRVLFMKGEERLVVLLDDKNKKRGEDAVASLPFPLSPAGMAPRSGLPAAFGAAPGNRAASANPLTAPGRAPQVMPSSPGYSPGSAPGSQGYTPSATNSPTTGGLPGPAPDTASPNSAPARYPTEKLPARSRALSNMLTTTPDVVRSEMKKGNN